MKPDDDPSPPYDPVAEELRYRFRPRNKNYLWHKMITQVEAAADQLFSSAIDPPKQKHKEPEMIASPSQFKTNGQATEEHQNERESGTAAEGEAVKKEPRVITVVGKPPRKHSVHWTESERKGVVAMAAARLRADGVGTVPEKGDRMGNSIIMDAFRSAQRQLLPVARQKIISCRGNLDATRLVEDLANELRRPPTKTAPANPPSATPVAGQPTAVNSQAGSGNAGAAVDVSQPSPEPAPVPPTAPAVAEDPVTAAALVLCKALTDSKKQTNELIGMHALMLEEIAGLHARLDAQEERMRSMDKTERKEVAQERAKLTTVAILGCRKDEFDHIQRNALERGLKLDLRHYEQDSRVRPISAEFAVAMKFINAGWSQQMDHDIDRRKSQVVQGGITKVVQQLECWFGGA